MNRSGTRSPRRNRRQRAGWTLLELSIVVTISSIVFMLAVVTLAAMFRVKVQMAGDTEQDVSIARLANRLRIDAHDAVSATVDDGCNLDLADGRSVRYTATPTGVVREVARSGEIQHRDAFRLPRRAKVVFSSHAQQPHDQERGQLLNVAITAAELHDQLYAIPARPIEIIAAVNLHRQAPPAEAAR